MKSFEEFLTEFSTNMCAANSNVARHVYENIIWREKNRIKMAEFSNVGRAALSAVAEEISMVCNMNNSDFKLNRKLHRQTVGRMISAALEPLGYVPDKRCRVITERETEFTSAMSYVLREDLAKEIIIKKIEVK